MKLEKLIKEANITEKELRLILRAKKPVKFSKINHDFGKEHIKIGVVSDLHIGSKYFVLPAFEAAVQAFNREKVDAIYCPGEIIEGMSGRDGQIYELSEIGYTSQLNRAISLLQAFRQPFYFIVGNHDLWAKNKANGGLLVGPEIERRNKNCHFMGEMEARINIGLDNYLWLTHRGNSAYALSYPGQKMINGLEGGTKPHIIINGHLHKSLYMFYRNIHFIEGGTLQAQTEFMAMKGSPAMLGWWTINIFFNKRGIERFNPTWYPFFK